MSFTSVCCSSASQPTPRVPKNLAHAWAMTPIVAACTGLTPIAKSNGTTTAIGAPKPAMPCRKDAKTQLSARMMNSSLRLKRAMPCRRAS
jgi:hypothetical protein